VFRSYLSSTLVREERRAGHASPAAALRYQHATEDRDRVLAAALADLAERAEIIPMREARAAATDERKDAAGRSLE
jgi:hypothetical protein